VKNNQIPNRRNALKVMGSAMIPSLFPFPLFSAPSAGGEKQKPVTVITIGAGNRGSTYSAYATDHPEKMKLVGVAEPIKERREKFRIGFQIPDKQCFNTWDDVFKVPKFADAVIISTPDKLHFGPAMKALEMGYHILLEKPISPSLEECIALQQRANQSASIVAVCHVLRYTPYFKKLKSIVETGALGELVSIDHFEPVGYWHMAHSYVRGNWRKESESSFMLLAKSCHDLDILRWLVDKPCKQIASFGSLKHFKPENAPEGHSKRCIDNCKAEPNCPYSALKVYLDMNRKGWPVSVITEDLSLEGRMKALKEGPYGRCVYHCDNDVVDHQVVSMQFENDITVNFTMSGFTPQAGMGMRQTRLMGTHGYLEGDMNAFKFTAFNGNKIEEFRTDQLGGDAGSGHGGGDRGIITNFVDAVREKNPKLLSSNIDVSIESHIMAFKGEESRKKGAIISIL